MQQQDSQSDSVQLLQQLKAWQKEQQQKLAEQQENQRKFLMEKQSRLFELLNSSRTSEASDRDSVSRTSIEDVPLRKPRQVKSFDEILQTSLCSAKEVQPQQPGCEKKFPFLKKGQGIARFGVKPRGKKTQVKKTQGKENKGPKKTARAARPPAVDPAIREDPSSFTPPNISALPIASTETVIPKVTAVVPAETTCEEPSLLSQGRTEDELMVFELLERFATINSSFCSTSSLIGNLLEKGITQLPSPSKVVTFLSQKSALNFFSPRSERHVHFAETPEASTEQPGHFPDSLTTEVSNSPFVSNTIKSITFHDLDGTDGESVKDQEEVKVPSEELPVPPASMPIASHSNITLDSMNPDIVYQSSLLRSRLLSIEREISNYRRETANLRKAKKEHEEARLKLEQEQEKFKRYAENEKRRMQLLYVEEQKRIKGEPKLDKKDDRIEQDRLREEIERMKEDFRSKETKWLASQTKMQERIRTLEVKNRELTQQVTDLKNEEHNLRRRLNSSLRPGAQLRKPSSEPDSASKENIPLAERRLPSEADSPVILKETEAALLVTGKRNEVPQESKQRIISTATALLPNLDNTEMCEHAATAPKPSENIPRGGLAQTELPDGTRMITYANGNRKEVFPNGQGCRITYYNGDVKRTLPDGTVIYTYSDSGTEQTTKPDGTEILKFSNGQSETSFKDGRKEVIYPDGARRTKYPDGREEAQWPDGTKLWNDGRGHGILTYPSGAREIYTPICKRREYPDGTVKTVYDNGRTETRYANGRIRVKDAGGNIITDTGVPTS